MFEKKYIFRFDEKKSREEILDIVGKVFYEDNIVTEDFTKAIKQREIDFPTGMVLENGTHTAISHTDDKYVKTDKIAIVVNKEPVSFRNIESGEENVNCKVFFVMALTKENKNDILSGMAELFEDHEEMLNEFLTMTDDEILETLL